MLVRASCFAGAALIASPAGAAVFSADVVAGGPALIQEHQGERVSLLRTESGSACVATAGIDLDRSVYLGPDGEAVDPADVRRSRAAHVAVLDEGRGPETLRVSFKYPVDAARPAYISDGARVIDLRGDLDASGDVATVRDGDLIADLLAAPASWRLVAYSADTGRRVTDVLDAPSSAALATCAAALAETSLQAADDAAPAAAAREATPLIEPIGFVSDPGSPLLQQDEPPVADGAMIGLTLVDPGPDAPVATVEHARVCGLTDETRPLQRAALIRNRGFFSQIDHALIARGADGMIDRIYIQGIFDARRAPGDVWRASVSRAADAFDPQAEAVVSGCIGAAGHRLCARETPDGLALDMCFGELLSGDPFAEDPDRFGAPLSDLLTPAGLATPTRAGAPFVLPAGFGARASAPKPRGVPLAAAPPPDGEGVVVTPLPGGAVLLLSAAVALCAASRLRRRAA